MISLLAGRAAERAGNQAVAQAVIPAVDRVARVVLEAQEARVVLEALAARVVRVAPVARVEWVDSAGAHRDRRRRLFPGLPTEYCSRGPW